MAWLAILRSKTMTVHAFHFSSSLGSLPTFAVLHTKPTSNRGASGGNADLAADSFIG